MTGTTHDGLDIRVLGAIEASLHGMPVAIGGPRQRALLALLAVQARRSVPADRLIEELWAGQPPDGAEVTLRSYVSRLRSALGDGVAIRASAAGYALDLPVDRIDAERFERGIRDGEAALDRRNARRAAADLRAALGLWRGLPFGELGQDGSLRFAAERLMELRLHAVELRVEADLALGNAASLVEELEALVREHPYREAYWRQLMLALYRAERQADALAAYHRARTALDEQLGLEPGEELQALEAAILRHDVPPATPPEERHNLPVPLTSFIGREAELDDIASLIGESRLVTLSGVGGVGKTRLAIESARSVLGDYPDGVFFVDLAPLADPSLVARHVAGVLDVREQPNVAPLDRLSAHMRPLELLLVLDNCEHVRDACAQLASRLLAVCPSLRILATSREVLGVPGEADYAVPPLVVPSAHGDIAAARGSEAVRLFLARARAARPGLADDDATIETIARICADLDGLPLGIELAAARARVLSMTEIGSRLRDRFQFLVSWRRLAAARHRTLREAMDWSYELLGADERRLLAELSVFAGGFTLDAVAGVCSGPASEHALELVERLVDASLVVVDQSTEPTRYRLLETVRQYGAERLAADGQTDALRDRHARHFAVFAEAAWGPLRRSGVEKGWIARVGQDRDNIRAALASSRDSGEHDRALVIAEAMWWFSWIRGEIAEGREQLQAAVEAANQSDPDLRGRGFLGVAGLAWAQGDLAAALEYATRASVLFEQVGNNLEAGSAYNTLGLVAIGHGDFVRARAMLEAALAKFQSPEIEPAFRDRNLAVVIDNLGSVAHDLGEDDRAIERYTEARAINAALDDEEGVAMNDLHLAIMIIKRGDIDEARRLLAGALRVYQRIRFLHYVAECLETASVVANLTASWHIAARMLGAGLRVRDEAGTSPVPFFARLRERESAAARSGLGDGAFDRAFDEGAQWSADTAVAEAITFLAG